MRTIFLLLLTLLSVVSIQAQTFLGSYGNRNARLAEIMPLDKSILECVYSYKIYDTELDESREFYKILEIGNKFSKFSNYGSYRVDSIVKTDYPKGLTVNEYGRLVKSNRPTTESLIKDIKLGSIRSYDKVYMDYYVFEEPTPNIQWKLESETKTICGYNCHQATAVFRGRKWTAWYCDLPINNGPWKFGNLPGLILKIKDENNEHVFEAIIIRKSNNEFGLKKLNYQKTSREKFNKALSDYKSNPALFISGSPNTPKDNNGNEFIPNNRLFFNPIEKE